MKHYLDCKEKRHSRNKAFDKYTGLSNLVGLGGPDLIQYVDFFYKRGFKNINIWEDNKDILFAQIKQLPQARVSLNMGDILNAPILKDTLYDLDFCRSLLCAKDHIKKFKTNTVFTFAIRPLGKETTIELFCTYRGEFLKYIGEEYFQSNKSTYNYICYKDKASMIMIY